MHHVSDVHCSADGCAAAGAVAQIPVFTAMIAVMLNLEAGSVQKFIGIGFAVGGSICMVSSSFTLSLTGHRLCFHRQCWRLPA